MMVGKADLGALAAETKALLLRRSVPDAEALLRLAESQIQKYVKDLRALRSFW